MPRRIPRPSAVPRRYVAWLDICGVSPVLAGQLWDALQHVQHAEAKSLCWFFRRLERRPIATIPEVMESHKARVSPQTWVSLIEQCVDAGLLTRSAGNQITHALLSWVDHTGAWKC